MNKKKLNGQDWERKTYHFCILALV